MKDRLTALNPILCGFLAGILLTAGLAPCGSMILCVGFDGHLEIEQARKACCEGHSHGSAEAGSCGGDCSDFRLEMPTTAAKQRPDFSLPLDDGRVLTAQDDDGRSLRPTASGQLSTPPPSPTFALLNSVVLLT